MILLKILAFASGIPIFASLIEKNKGINKILVSMNCHPSNKMLQNEASKILGNLSTENLLIELISHHNKLSETFDCEDKIKVENFKQANIQLSNLLKINQKIIDKDIENNKTVKILNIIIKIKLMNCFL